MMCWARSGTRGPLRNLYLSMLQRFGVEANRFGLSTGAMRDLELA